MKKQIKSVALNNGDVIGITKSVDGVMDVLMGLQPATIIIERKNLIRLKAGRITYTLFLQHPPEIAPVAHQDAAGATLEGN